MEDFIKCFELLNKDCYKIFNNSFLAEYNENFKSNYPNYGSFIMDRLGYINYVSTGAYQKSAAFRYSSCRRR
jgi:hypothetical protein